MIQYNDLLSEQSNNFYPKLFSSFSPLSMEQYYKKILPRLEKEADAEALKYLKKQGAEPADATSRYPYTVNIPKSLDQLAKGDFSPAYSFVVEKPFMTSVGPVWFRDGRKGVPLRFGYKNGDSRHVTDIVLGDSTPHAAIAGSTGQGKTVTMDAAVVTSLLELPPWWVQYVSCDAKIIGARKYGTDFNTDHIAGVGATSDISYVLSILNNAVTRMNRLNTIFSKAGCDKIEDFCTITGLCLPHIVIEYDEIQSAIQAASGSAKTELVTLLDLIARKGRNTGIHLIIGSQEVAGELAPAMKNITVRCAMGCFQDVSEKMLGNDAAKFNMGKKGRLLINLESQNKNAENNIMVRVPYSPPEWFAGVCEELRALCKGIGWDHHTSFFDEEDAYYFKESPKYSDFVNKFPIDKDTIILGEPAYEVVKGLQCSNLQYNCEKKEATLIYASQPLDLKRLFLMFKTSIERCGNQVINSVVAVNRSFLKEPFSAKGLVNGGFYAISDSAKDSWLAVLTSVIYTRKLIMDVEQHVDSEPIVSEESDALFYAEFGKGSAYDTLRNRSRYYYAHGILHTGETTAKQLGLTNKTGEDLEKTVAKYCRNVINIVTSANCASVECKASDFKPAYWWFLGFEDIIGLTVKGSTPLQDQFNDLVRKAYAYNVRILLFTESISEISFVAPEIGWTVTLGARDTEMNSRLKVEGFPGLDQTPKMLAIQTVLNAGGQPAFNKFKKALFDDETVGD